MRAVVPLQADDVLDAEIALEFGHVADVRPAKPVNGLIVIADCKHDVFRPGEQLQPAVLEPVGVLELVHQDVPEAVPVVLAQDLVPGKELEGAQQQLSEVHRALALALLVVGGVDLGVTAGDFVPDLDVSRAPALLFLCVDEILRFPRWESVLVDAERLQHALHRGVLVLGIEDLKELRQAGVAVVRAQQAVAQAVKGADPHAAGADRQHRRDAREHLACRLVGEGHGENAARAHVPGLDQPGDASSENARLPRAGASEDQRRLVGKGDCGELLGIEVFEERHRTGAKGVILLQRLPAAGRIRVQVPTLYVCPPSRACPLSTLATVSASFFVAKPDSRTPYTRLSPTFSGTISAGYPALRRFL